MDLYSFKSGAAGSAPSAPVSPSVGYPTNSNPASGVAPTVPGAYWFHQLAAEFKTLFTAASVTPAAGTLTQLRDALYALFYTKTQLNTSGQSTVHWDNVGDGRRAAITNLGSDLATTALWSSGSLNTLTTPGEYYFTSGATDTPVSSGLLKVWRENANHVYQFVQASSGGYIYSRYSVAPGSWSSWNRYVENAELAGKSDVGHVHSWASITGKPDLGDLHYNGTTGSWWFVTAGGVIVQFGSVSVASGVSGTISVDLGTSWTSSFLSGSASDSGAACYPTGIGPNPSFPLSKILVSAPNYIINQSTGATELRGAAVFRWVAIGN